MRQLFSLLRSSIGRAALVGPVGRRCAALAITSSASAALALSVSSPAECSSPSLGGWTLAYFPVPGAPGEAQRILLALSGAEWDDLRVPGTKWGAVKPTTKYGQMPMLTNADGKHLSQSQAMSRYLARGITVDGTPLYPSDAWLAFQVDEFVDALSDARAMLSSTFAIKDLEEKKAARAALFATDGTGKMFEQFKKIESQISGSNGYMVGSKLTLADVWMYASYATLTSGFLDGVPEDWLEKLPKTKASISNVAAQPAIQSYLKSQAEGGAFGAKFYAKLLAASQ